MTDERLSQTGDDESVERWLVARHHDLGASLEAELDIQAGLSDMGIALEHLEIGDEIRDLLYTQAGLQAILPTFPKSTRKRNAYQALDRRPSWIRDNEDR